MAAKTKTTLAGKAVKKTEEPKYGYGARPIMPVKSTVLDCPSCGTKYIKTRAGQKTCIRCVYKR